jgi:flavin reductase (DIM6/NTAB) family NADH-FMN oxidoreductase RutF
VICSKTSYMTTRPLTPIEFRLALGQFVTGVTVVTVERSPGEVRGMTANSFASVSLDPLLVLVCIDQKARMLPVLSKKKRFGVSVLTAGQQAISEFFTQPEQDPAAEVGLGIHFRWTTGGIPVLKNTLMQLGCEVVASHVSGDHTIFIAEVETADIHEGDPLLYFRGEYRRLGPLVP